MDYKAIQFTYMQLFQFHHKNYHTHTTRESTFTHRIWRDYLEMLRGYFIASECTINNKKYKISHVNSYGGVLVLSYMNDEINEMCTINLENM